MTPPGRVFRYRRRALWGLVSGLYVLAFPYHPKLRSPNELCRLYQAKAIVDFGKVSLNEVLQQLGYIGDLSFYGGRFYPSKAPLLSVLAAPIYKVLEDRAAGAQVPELAWVYWSRFFLTVLPTLGMLALLWRFLGAYVSEAVADAVTATTALGSLAFSYSLLFMSHQTTAVLLFSAFYCLWRYFRGDWRSWALALAGAAAGAAVAAEYTGALGVLCLAGYAVVSCSQRKEKSWAQRWAALAQVAGLVALGAAPFLGALMAYHASCFAGPLDSGYKHLAQAGYQAWHVGGFLGIGLPDPRALGLSFFSPLRGLFTLAPFLLLALPGMVVLYRRGPGGQDRALFWLSAAMLAGYAYFTSSFSYESWGWTTGPRHLTPLPAFLALPAALWLQTLFREGAGESSPLRALGAAACAASILVTGMLTLIDYIPDSTSNGLFALAVPLFAHGYGPPNALMFWGLTNPVSGALLIAAVVLAAALVFWTLAGSKRASLATGVLGVILISGYLGVLRLTTRYDDGDRGALELLRQDWLAPPGRPVDLWTPVDLS